MGPGFALRRESGHAPNRLQDGQKHDPPYKEVTTYRAGAYTSTFNDALFSRGS